jgi:DNA-binding NarL/FixJ family response regulator
VASRSTSLVHLFVDDRAQVLARWKQAFRAARAEPLAGARKVLKGEGTAAVWVRLPAKKAALRRMQAVVDAAGAVPVLVLADAPGEGQALELLGMGARAYCNTHAAPLVLQRAWATVEAGGLWIGEDLMLRLVRATARAAAVTGWPADAGSLTAKEQEVLGQLVRGDACGAVAASLGLTDRTVKSRLKAILQKADVSDRFSLTRRLVSGTSAREVPLVADQ